MVKLLPNASLKLKKNSEFKSSDYVRTTTKIRPDIFELMNDVQSTIGLNPYIQINKALELWFLDGCPVVTEEIKD